MFSLGNPTSKPTASAAELAVLDESRRLRKTVEAAEARTLMLAVEWADLHPSDNPVRRPSKTTISRVWTTNAPQPLPSTWVSPTVQAPL